MSEWIELPTASLDYRAIYGLLAGSVVPRPIAWISTFGSEGQPNLAPFSFYTVLCVTPPTLGVSISRRGERLKDTAANILAAGDYVINVVPVELARAMALTAGEWEPGVDEFALAGLTAVEAVDVRAPRVMESPLSMECRFTSATDYGEAPGSYTLIAGTVVRFHVRESLLDRGRIQPFGALGRLSGHNYCTTERLLRFTVPTTPPAREAG